MRKALLGVALALWLAPPAHATTATRVLYAGDWTGQMEIFAVDPTGKAPVAQLTHWHGRCYDGPDYFGYPFQTLHLFAAPNGRSVLVGCGRALWLMRGDGADARRIGESPAFWSEDTMSPNGRWEARTDAGSVTVIRRSDGAVVARARLSAYAVRWAPDGRRLAIGSDDGISVLDMRTRRVRILTGDPRFEVPSTTYVRRTGIDFAWAPDSRSIAYLPGSRTYYGADTSIVTGDLKTVDLAGRTRTLVSADQAYGGRMTAVAWAKAPPGAKYQTPEPAPAERRSPQGLLADGRIDMLAADGTRVAFEACNNIFVWTPSSKHVETVHWSESTVNSEYGSSSGSCAARDRYAFYDLALSGDRVVYALVEGCHSMPLTLFAATVGSGRGGTAFEHGSTVCGSPFYHGIGRLAGSGGLLVFDEWQEVSPAAPGSIGFPTTSATVRRLDEAACPCPGLFSTLGPLYPADVDANRVVVYGDNETIVLDRNGERLLSLRVKAVAAQLAGPELILLLRGRLLDYDVRSAELLHTWTLPDVPTGPFCDWRTCPPHDLAFHDAARGLAAYTINGELHLLRTADGADSVIAPASLARFMDEGLVYADGSRLHLVPFASLPLRGF